MVNNRIKQNISGAIAVLGLVGFIVIFVLELGYGIDVNNWFWNLAFCTLFVDGLLFFKYRKHANKDKNHRKK